MSCIGVRRFVAACVFLLVQMSLVTPVAGQSTSDPIRSVDDLVNLKNRTNLAPVPVDLEATVNHWDPERYAIFVQSGDEAIYVGLEDETLRAQDRKAGDIIRIVGIFYANDYRIDASKIELTSTGKPAIPMRFQCSKLALGEHWSRRATTTATVKAVNIAMDRTYLLLDDNGTTFVSSIKNQLDHAATMRLVNAEVELTGTIGCEVDRSTNEPTRFMVYLMDVADLTRQTSPTPAAYQETTLADLVQQTPQVEGETFQVTCQLGHVENHSLLLLEDGHESLAIQSAATELLSNGDMVTVFGTTQQSADGLRRIVHVVQTVGQSPLPAAPILAANVIADQSVSHRRASVLGELQSTSSSGEERRLQFAAKGVEYTVVFDEFDEVFERLQLSSARTILADGYLKSPASAADGQFILELESSNGLSIQQTWPQLDRRSVIPILYILVSAALLGLGCAWFFKRQVQRKAVELSGMTTRLHSTFEAIREGILVVGRDGQPEQFNKRLGEILGVDFSKTTNPINVEDVLAGCLDQPETFKEFWSEVEAVPGCIRSLRLHTNQTVGAKSLVIETVPVRDDADQFMARLWTFCDITDQQQLETRLQQAQKMEAVGRLAGGVAHDFNNLLMVLSGSLELFRFQYEDKTPDDGIKLIDAAEGATRKATRLVQQLLGFSRKTALEMRVVDPSMVVSHLLEMLRHSIDANVEIRLQQADDIWPTRIDTIQIEQVLLNLCLNARDALPKRGGCITVSTKNTTDGPVGDAVRITIQDDGIGMTPEVQDKLFEPFFTTKPVGEGTGLGLAMSQGIIDQHSGRIRFESTPGQGSRFEIDLPRSTEKLSVYPIAKPRKLESVSGRILLADDEASVRTLIVQTLEQFGYEVVPVSNGQAALDVMQIDDRIELVVLDLTMPGVSGFEAFGEISKKHPHIPVMICSGYACNSEVFASKFDRIPAAIVTKPFGLEDFVEQVAAVLKQGTPANPVG